MLRLTGVIQFRRLDDVRRLCPEMRLGHFLAAAVKLGSMPAGVNALNTCSPTMSVANIIDVKSADFDQLT